MSEESSPSESRSSANPILIVIIILLLLLCGYLFFSKDPSDTAATAPPIPPMNQPVPEPGTYILLQDIPEPPRVDNNPDETLRILLEETEKIREVKREIPKIFSKLRPYTENNEFIWIIDPEGDPQRIQLYRQIQRALKLVDHLNGPINGDWEQTRQQVIAFQSEYAIANDGYFGRNTLGKICTIYLDQISKED